ncbi:MAG TPA: hypothetical protein ACQGQH_03310 [Xylella sp.]
MQQSFHAWLVGYTSAQVLANEISVLRAGSGDFGVNLFVSSPERVDEEVFRLLRACRMGFASLRYR